MNPLKIIDEKYFAKFTIHITHRIFKKMLHAVAKDRS
jgi:hypothetical protein